MSVAVSSGAVAASDFAAGPELPSRRARTSMSVHSQSAAQPASYAAATPEFPRHVVTAVLVSHDGARWLPDALAGLLGQERPVQNVIAADTGSADDSARLLAEASATSGCCTSPAAPASAPPSTRPSAPPAC